MVMGNIAHLVVMMADSIYKTWCESVNDASDRHAVLYISEIHAVLAEIRFLSASVENQKYP